MRPTRAVQTNIVKWNLIGDSGGGIHSALTVAVRRQDGPARGGTMIWQGRSTRIGGVRGVQTNGRSGGETFL